MTDNPQLYNQLAANWDQAVSPGFAGEVHVLAATYAFAATHQAADIAPFDLTAPAGSITAAMAINNVGNLALGPFTVNPITINVPTSTLGNYRFVVWCLPNSHQPLLCIDLGTPTPNPDTLTLTLTGHFLTATP